MGIWSSLIKLVEQLLSMLYGITHNYGLAIILLTIIIRTIMYPLMQKQMISMRETQKIQPLMQEIQRKYKHDKERMNQELMRLYKEHKVNPMGGCLPLIIQMPILILFFQVLRGFEYFVPNTEIIDGGFLWIKNVVEYQGEMVAGLAAPDQLFGVIGNYNIGILPILVGVSMYFQQKLTMPPVTVASQSDSSSNPAFNTQKMMGTIMPVMIAFISFSLPSGLSLYWFTSTLFDIIQKLVINKKQPEIKKEPDISQKTEIKEKEQEQPEEKVAQQKNSEQEFSWIPGYEKDSVKQKKQNKKGKNQGKGN